MVQATGESPKAVPFERRPTPENRIFIMSEAGLDIQARRVDWPGVAACAVSAYTLALQNNAMNVAGPVLAHEFSVGVADASAVTLVYTVPITATLIAAGRLGDVFGARLMFRVGMGLYLIS